MTEYRFGIGSLINIKELLAHARNVTHFLMQSVYKLRNKSFLEWSIERKPVNLSNANYSLDFDSMNFIIAYFSKVVENGTNGVFVSVNFWDKGCARAKCNEIFGAKNFKSNFQIAKKKSKQKKNSQALSPCLPYLYSHSLLQLAAPRARVTPKIFRYFSIFFNQTSPFFACADLIWTYNLWNTCLKGCGGWATWL